MADERVKPKPARKKRAAAAVGDYQVGYGKPPKETQFQPGQSGNQLGRRRGSKNRGTLIDEFLSALATVKVGDSTVTMRRDMVLVQQLWSKGASGNVASARMLLEFARAYPPPAKVIEATPEREEQRKAALGRLFKRLERTEQAAESGEANKEQEKPKEELPCNVIPF